MVGEETGQFDGASRYPVRGSSGGSVGEQPGDVVNEHVRTGTGRHDDRPMGRVEHLDGVAGHGDRLFRVPGIEGRLATTGLVECESHLVSGPFEQANGGDADLR